MLASATALDGRDADRESGNRWPIVITCEHGGNRVPKLYRELFHGQRRLLESHRGYDPGGWSWQERWQPHLQRRWWSPR